jgi:DNA-binding IclR family transcriptional regulator
MKNSPHLERAGVAAVHHVVDILQALKDANLPVGVNEIARTVGMHKSTVSRVLASLEERGFVEREQHGVRFRLGIGLLSLTGPLLANLDLVNVGRPLLAAMAAETGETSGTCVWRHGSAVMLDEVRGSRAVAHYIQPGRPMAAHCSAGGKCFLAYMNDEALATYLEQPLVAVTTHSITDITALKAELSAVKKNGFATNIEELELESCAVAAPVFDHRREVTAAMLLAIPKHRFTAVTKRRLIETIKRHADQLSKRLGG